MEATDDEGPDLTPWYQASRELERVIREYQRLNAEGSPLRCRALSIAINHLETARLWSDHGLRAEENGY